MDSSILLTKMFIPSLPHEIIHRHHLLEGLTAGLKAGKSLTLVSAPAGYGKSTLIAEWITAHQDQAAWLSLDNRDNNLLRFWRYFVTALPGVLHFLGDLQSLFREVHRVMRPGGIFSFTIAPADLEGPYEKENTAWDIPIFRHSIPYIRGLLAENSFLLEKEQRMLIKGADKVNYNMLFSALVARREG